MVSMDVDEVMVSCLPPRLEAALAGKPRPSANGKKVSGDLEDGEINDELSKAAVSLTARLRRTPPSVASSVASSRASSRAPSPAPQAVPSAACTDTSDVSTEPETPSCEPSPSLSYPEETPADDEIPGLGPPTKSSLPLSLEELDHAKDLVLDLLGWGVPPEYLLQSGVSAQAIYRIFTDLRLRLPKSMEAPSAS